MNIKADFFRFLKNKINLFLLALSSFFAVLTFMVSSNSKRPITVVIQNLLATNRSYPTSSKNALLEMLHSADMILLFMLYLIYSFWLSDFDNGRVKQLFLASGDRFGIYFRKVVTIFLMTTVFYFMYLIASFVCTYFIFGVHVSTSILEIIRTIAFQLIIIFLLLSISFPLIFVLKNTHIIITCLFLYPVVIQLLFILIKPLVNEGILNKIAEFEPLVLFSSFGINQSLSYIQVSSFSLLLIFTFLIIGNFLFRRSELR